MRCRAGALFSVGLLACSALTSSLATAAPPDAAKLRSAADQFDAGTRAFKAGDYAEAAGHFEAADAAVPSPKALRMALRSRAEAKDGARAATHAALALARYPDDSDTSKLARETISKLGGDLHKLEVSCAPPCTLETGGRPVLGEATTRWTVYVDPGTVRVHATFAGGVGDKEASIEATAGSAGALRFEPDDDGKPSAPAAAPAPVAVGAGEGGADSGAAASSGSGLHPAFFIAGLVATAGLGGLTVWSGLDTRNNPGVDVVRQRCAGKGTACPEYQDGLARETRTNILIGATAGVGVLTGVVGLLLTNWGGSAPPAAESSTLSAQPVVGSGEAGFTARGRF